MNKHINIPISLTMTRNVMTIKFDVPSVLLAIELMKNNDTLEKLSAGRKWRTSRKLLNEYTHTHTHLHTHTSRQTRLLLTVNVPLAVTLKLYGTQQHRHWPRTRQRCTTHTTDPSLFASHYQN